MKNKITMLFGLLALLFLTVPKNVFAEKVNVAIAIDVRGDVTIISTGQPVQNLTVGMEVAEGDVITTAAQAYVKLIRTDSSIIKLSEKTQLTIEATAPEETKGSVFGVKVGRIFMNVFKEEGVSKKFLIKTPTSVCAVRGTEIDVNVDEAGAATYTLFSGNVEISNEYGTVQLTEGSQTQTQANQPPAAPVTVNLTTIERWDQKAEEPAPKPQPQPEQKPAEPTKPPVEKVEPPAEPEVQPEDVTIPEPPALPLEEASPTRP